MKQRLTAFFLFCLIFVACCSCSGSDDKNSFSSASIEYSDNKNRDEAQSELSEKSKAGITAASSSINSPLELDAWGTAAKYCTYENSYVNVPVKITSVRRGKNIAAEVKAIADKSGFISYFEPDENEEYAIAEYEISLDGFPVDKGGTLIDITANITGTDGGLIKLDSGAYWGASAISLNQEKYFYEGIVKGRFAFKIIKNRTDYLIVLGEAGETQAFVKGV